MKNLCFILLALIASVAAAQVKTDAQLTTQSNVIRNETVQNANTKVRVADMFQALIDNKANLDLNILSDRGSYNASGNTFPSTGGSGTSGAIKRGNLWTISVSGTLGGTAVVAGQVIRAFVDSPGQTAGNWNISGAGGGGGGGTWGSITGTLSSQTDLQNVLTGKAERYPVTNRQTVDYTLVLTDDGKTVEMNSTSPTVVTIPNNTTVAYPLYTLISIVQYNTGAVTIAAAGGVTLNSQSGTLTVPGRYSIVVIYKIGTNEWDVWDGSAPNITSPTYGGTGVNNGSKTITIGGNLTTTGAFNTTIAASGSNTVTLPNASITVARNDAAQTFTGVQTFSAAPVFSTAFTLPNGTVATTGSASAGGTNVSTQQYVENALAGVSGWSSNGTTTLGGPVTVVGTTTNIIKYRFNGMAATQTAGAGLLLANETAAISGTQQASPSITWEGQGFATGVNNSQVVRFGSYVTPTQLATNPGGVWTLFSNINGAGNVTLLSIGHGSNTTATFTANIALGTGSNISWTGRGNITAPSTSAYNFNQSSGSANAILNAGTIVQTYVAKTANYTLVTSDQFVECTSGSFTITLPTAVSAAGKSYTIDNSGAGTITMATTSSQTIDGSAPGTVAAGAKLTVYSNGANWRTY